MKQDINLLLKKFATVSRQATFETTSDIVIDGIEIKSGFETDGASLPRWVILSSLMMILVGGLSDGMLSTSSLLIGWLVVLLAYLFPPFGKYTVAAIAHDYLLSTTTREHADRRMKEILSVLGISSLWSKAMYRIVRINSYIVHREMG